MTDHQVEVSRANDALLDAVNEVSVHDRSEETRTLQQHVGDILRNGGFTVYDNSIVIDLNFQFASAEFIISGKTVTVSF